MTRSLLMAAALVLLPLVAAATSRSVRLPDSLCGGSDSIYADSFETGGVFTSDASAGSGGAVSGRTSRSFYSPAYGMQTYYAYVPPQYDPAQPAPLMVVLEGSAGPPPAADQSAQNLRDDWIAAADTYGYVVIAPVANGPHGGWLAPPSNDDNDYDLIGRALADAERAWNIERNRVSVWAYSAGGFIVWDMVLNHGAFWRPTPLYAGNLAALTVLGANSGYACDGDAAQCDALFAALPRHLPVAIYVANGDAHYAWAHADEQRMMANGWVWGENLGFHVFVGNHGTINAQQVSAAADFACRFALQP